MERRADKQIETEKKQFKTLEAYREHVVNNFTSLN